MSNHQGIFDTYARTGQRPTESASQQYYSSRAETSQNYQYTSSQGSSISRGLPQSTNSYVIEGRREEVQGDREGFLKWASQLTNDTVISGSSDYAVLTNLRDAIIELKGRYFNPKSGLSVVGAERDELNRRFFQVEHEIQGLLRRRIDYTTKDHQTGERTLDYSSLLNEKETQIVELEKKIQNLEERLRRASAREIELQNKIVGLKAEILSIRGLSGSQLDNAIKREQQYERSQVQLKNIKETFATAAGIWESQLKRYRSKYPNDNTWELDANITQRLTSSDVRPVNVNDFAFLQVHTDKTVEVPVQDTRTKRLIHVLATNLKNLSEKYPKLKSEIEGQIQEYFCQQIIDLIDVDSVDRLVEIVKFIPQSVRVENVYAYSSAKSRRVEFHLRVLVKALLEELEKLKAKTGAVLEIDEGVIGMINQEIMGVVSVDDILKVFRVVPKIVEVEKIVEKIVERLVEVPQIVPIEKYVEKIVEVPKYIEVEKIIHKPVEVVKIVDNLIEKLVPVEVIEQKIVEVPTSIDRPVPVNKEVAKIVEVQKLVERVVVNTEYREIEKPVNVFIPQKEICEIIVEKIVEKEKIVEVLKPVEVIVEKIITVEVQKVEIVEVERIVEKIIKEIVYEPVPQCEVAIKEVIKEVPIYIEKIVPVETVRTVVETVTQRVEVPVVTRQIIERVKPIQITVEKVVQVVVPRQIEKIVNHVAEKIVEVIKPVDRIVQVPLYQDRMVPVPYEVIKVVVEKIHVPHVVPIKCIEEKIVERPKIIEIEKPIIQYVKDIQIVNCQIEKIVEVPRTIERIKEVKIRVEKIVTKLVEVPKVVEVEKLVEKVVVVPRVVQTLVEVPQIVEVIVERIIQKPVVQIVEKIVEKVVTVERPIEVQKIKNVFIDVDRPIDIVREVPAIAEKVVEKKQVIQIPVEKYIPVQKQIPVEIFVDKIVPYKVDTLKVVQIEKPTVYVVDVPQVIDRKVQIPVEVVRVVPEIVETIRNVDRIVQVPIKDTKVVEVQVTKTYPVPVSEPKVYTQDKIVVNEKFTPVPYQTKVPVQVPVPQPAAAPRIIDRFVEKITESKVIEPKVIIVDRQVHIPVETVRVVEVDKVINYIQTEHKIVEKIVDKIVPAPTLEYIIQPEVLTVEKAVAIQTVSEKLKIVPEVREKIVTTNEIEKVTDKVPVYETKFEYVDRVERTEVPKFTTQERIVRVPQFQQKIFQRIVVMPQVVEVLKYVTEICELDTLVSGVSVDIEQQQLRYKQLYGVTRRQIEILLEQLKKLRTTQPHLIGIIELLERYLVDFDRLASVQRIVPVDREKIVEKEVNRAVLVPTQDSESLRTELAQGLLIQKLVVELKRLKKENPSLSINLDNDVGLVFFTEFYNSSNNNLGGNFKSQLREYTTQTLSKLNSLGGNWTNDHQLMLNTILQERFGMASTVQQANIQIEKARSISEKNSRALKEAENKWISMQSKLKQKQQWFSNLLANNSGLKNYPQLRKLADDLNSILVGSIISFEPVKIIDSQFEVGTSTIQRRSQAKIRELQLAYAAIVSQLEQSKVAPTAAIDTTSQTTISQLQYENNRLVREVESLKRSSSQATNNNQQILEYESRIKASTTRGQQLELQLKTANSRISDLESQLRTSTSRIKQLEEQLKVAKQVKSSAASQTNQLIDSKYSSSSSNNFSNNITKSNYEASYQSSNFNLQSRLAGSGIKPANSIVQPSSSSNYSTASGNYTGTGASGLQAASTYKPLGSTNIYSSGFGAEGSGSGSSQAFGAVGAPQIYSAGSSSSASYGQGPSLSSQYTANVTSTNFGPTTTSTFRDNVAMSSSGMRSSGTNIASSSLSNYTFQSKKYGQ